MRAKKRQKFLKRAIILLDARPVFCLVSSLYVTELINLKFIMSWTVLFSNICFHFVPRQRTLRLRRKWANESLEGRKESWRKLLSLMNICITKGTAYEQFAFESPIYLLYNNMSLKNYKYYIKWAATKACISTL